MSLPKGGVWLAIAGCGATGFLIAPLAMVIAISFTSSEILRFPPDGFSLRWYWALLDNVQFIEAAWTSFKLASVCAFFATLIGTTAALAIFRYQFMGRSLIFGLALSPLMLPQLILAISLLMYLSRVGLTGSFLSLLIGHVLVTLPFVLRLVLVGLERIDANIERAAAVAGASPVGVFFRVTIWLMFPGMFAGAAFSFIMSFDNIVVSLFFTTSRLITLPVEIYEYLEYADDPLIASISSVVVLFMVLLLVVLEKTIGFTRSFTAIGHG